MRIRPKATATGAAVLLSIGLCVGLAGPASATNGPQICSVQADLCANQNGGSDKSGTYVIAWNGGDDNNTFEARQLTGICGGYVSAEAACPFPDGSGLNNRYNGDAIAEFEDYSSSGGTLCIADSGSGTGSTALGACSPDGGWGGATGEVFILSGVKSFADIEDNPFWAVNYHYTVTPGDNGCGNNKPCWLVTAGKGAPLYENFPSANNQWDEFP
jgi:hypothetical protein